VGLFTEKEDITTSTENYKTNIQNGEQTNGQTEDIIIKNDKKMNKKTNRQTDNRQTNKRTNTSKFDQTNRRH
jgi:hypothetical protein